MSIGVAELVTSAAPVEDLVTRADNELYEAKHKGRNRVCAAKAAPSGVSLESGDDESSSSL
jgi:PleD family two-component response regulator